MSGSLAGGYRRTWIDHTLDVDASAESVMRLLADIDGWSAWTPGLKAVKRRSGPFAPGSAFTMVIATGALPPVVNVQCKLYQLSPTLIEWGGDLLGSSVRHRFELTALEDGRTRVRQLEYATGLFALLGRLAESAVYKHDLRWQNALRDKLERAR